ncbi:MAG: hypothetical protein H6765_01275 [Candidatus Peribacteria bacterium]|nr:MAG: hypothetical protein H6765_01275 [Candidatus Peribacteria bacterium]
MVEDVVERRRDRLCGNDLVRSDGDGNSLLYTIERDGIFDASGSGSEYSESGL